jgi:hypothetical protein
VSVNCGTEGCRSVLALPSGTASEFFDAFETAYFDGWLCLVNSPFEMMCPTCNRAQLRRLQSHQLLRGKLGDQPEWRRDIVLATWAAMLKVDDEYLRGTEMPICLRALLGIEKTANAAHVRDALEKIERAFSRQGGPNATVASQLAKAALAR